MKKAFESIHRLIEDEAYQNSMLPPQLKDPIAKGVACDEVPGAAGPFGLVATNPIPVNGALGELSYLSRLETSDGERLLFHRIGAVGNVDVFEAVSYSGKTWFVLFVDMYHPRRSRKAPEGLRIAKEARQFSGFHNSCQNFPYDFVEAKNGTADGIRMAYIPLSHVLKPIEDRAFNRPLSHKAKLDLVRGQLTSGMMHGGRDHSRDGARSESSEIGTRQQPQSLHQIPSQEIPPGFEECWKAAAAHLQRSGQGKVNWLKADLNPPMLEHLSFRLGNQLFFACLDAAPTFPFTENQRRGLNSIATGCKGHACLMPMQRVGGSWKPAMAGWGLVDAASRASIHPPDLVTVHKIEMTDWELHDFAVQVVRTYLEKQGRRLMSSQSNPSVDPSVWFIGDHGPEWVVVRAVRYPAERAAEPTNWQQIASRCSKLSSIGHFASVAIASALQSEAPINAPLWRGDGMHVRFKGLERISGT